MHVRPTTFWRLRAHVVIALASRARHRASADSPARTRTLTFPSDLTRFMARKNQGPRQPLSQRRPKVAVGKKSAVPRAGRKATSEPPLKATAKAKLTAKPKQAPKPKRTPKAARRPAPEPLVVYDQLLALYPEAHCELDFATPFQLLVATILSAQCTD